MSPITNIYLQMTNSLYSIKHNNIVENHINVEFILNMVKHEVKNYKSNGYTDRCFNGFNECNCKRR